MKIRSGFVSNSSSSSFIILYKNKSDFDCFKGFRGHTWLMENIDRFDSAFINQIVETFVSNVRWNYHERLDSAINDRDWIPNYFHSIYPEISTDINFSDNEFIKKLHSLLEKSGNKCEKADDLISVEELCKKLKVKSFSKKFLAVILDSGYKISAFEVADDEKYELGNKGESIPGDYLEHKFLPFVADYPDGDNILTYREGHH